jgi:hypothetical protein
MNGIPPSSSEQKPNTLESQPTTPQSHTSGHPSAEIKTPPSDSQIQSQTKPATTPKPGKLLILILIIVLILVFLIFSSVQNKQKKETSQHQQIPQTEESSSEISYQQVFQKTVNALEQNNLEKLYNVLAPSLKEIFSYQSFLEGFNAPETDEGKVTKVTIISGPQLKTGDQWGEDKWAEGEVEITREKTKRQFILRLVKENNQWWLFGTIETTNQTTTPTVTEKSKLSGQIEKGGCIIISSCNRTICVDEPRMPVCGDVRPEYACYQNAICERQTDGKCGWTQTKELKECLEKFL